MLGAVSAADRSRQAVGRSHCSQLEERMFLAEGTVGTPGPRPVTSNTWGEGNPGNSIEEHDLTASITSTGKHPR